MAIPNDLYTGETPNVPGGSGYLAEIYRPVGGTYKYVNVTRDYPWTVSQYAKNNAARIILKEYQVNESIMKQQANFYIQGLTDLERTGSSGGNFVGQNPRQVYEELYPRDLPTGFVYDFPYFSDINFEVNTPPWASLDALESVSKGIKSATDLASDVSNIFGPTVQGTVSKGLEAIEKVISVAGAAIPAALSFNYPKVGIMDRPRIWERHDFRTITVTCPLFNTLAPDDWKKNRLLCELLVNQNLYNKRDFITSIPPVYYEVLVYGQHYSWASCVTRLTIYNRGNNRLIREEDGIYNIPDVYEIQMDLTDMVMPSKNLFQGINDRTVTGDIVESGFQNLTPEETVPGFTLNLAGDVAEAGRNLTEVLQER